MKYDSGQLMLIDLMRKNTTNNEGSYPEISDHLDYAKFTI